MESALLDAKPQSTVGQAIIVTRAVAVVVVTVMKCVDIADIVMIPMIVTQIAKTTPIVCLKSTANSTGGVNT